MFYSFYLITFYARRPVFLHYVVLSQHFQIHFQKQICSSFSTDKWIELILLLNILNTNSALIKSFKKRNVSLYLLITSPYHILITSSNCQRLCFVRVCVYACFTNHSYKSFDVTLKKFSIAKLTFRFQKNIKYFIFLQNLFITKLFFLSQTKDSNSSLVPSFSTD